ncbi:MAG: hypothetical protein CM15mP74_30830 [Halieaceae bacterium]|nr:MAG: hypothetical protein CM15mP74_30830 [Halieaceae bacterium]
MITFERAEVEVLGDGPLMPDAWARLIDGAAVLFAWEQLGLAESALTQARDYALQRFAFGRAIGSYQAIKHKLANMYVKNALARSNAYFGVWALAEGSDDSAAGRRDRARRCDSGINLCGGREYPDPRRHGIYLGVRLPLLLPSREAAEFGHR